MVPASFDFCLANLNRILAVGQGPVVEHCWTAKVVLEVDEENGDPIGCETLKASEVHWLIHSSIVD